MRDWKIDPKLLCDKHLLGSHFELHKAVGNLRHSGKWTMALVKKGYLEPQNFKPRHDALATEMQYRNYKHESELDVSGLSLPKGKVDVKQSISDLKKRCKECSKRIAEVEG